MYKYDCKHHKTRLKIANLRAVSRGIQPESDDIIRIWPKRAGTSLEEICTSYVGNTTILSQSEHLKVTRTSTSEGFIRIKLYIGLR